MAPRANRGWSGNAVCELAGHAGGALSASAHIVEVAAMDQSLAVSSSSDQGAAGDSATLGGSATYEFTVAAAAPTRSLIGKRYGDAVLDTYLYAWRPTTIYNTVSTMVVGRTSYGEMRVLMRFPLAKLAGPDVGSAVLHLSRSSGSTSVPLRAYRLKRTDIAWPWATWNLYKPGTPWSSPGASGAGADYWADVYCDSPSFTALDVTALARAAVAAGEPSLDLLIVDPAPVSGRYVSLYSSEYPLADSGALARGPSGAGRISRPYRSLGWARLACTGERS